MAAPALFAFAGFLGAVGGLLSSKAEQRAEKFNEREALRAASLTRQQGEAKARLTRRLANRAIGSEKARLGASGVRSDTGSPEQSLALAEFEKELEILTIKHNAEIEAERYELIAEQARRRRKDAKRAGLIKAAGSIAGGFARGGG